MDLEEVDRAVSREKESIRLVGEEEEPTVDEPKEAVDILRMWQMQSLRRFGGGEEGAVREEEGVVKEEVKEEEGMVKEEAAVRKRIRQQAVGGVEEEAGEVEEGQPWTEPQIKVSDVSVCLASIGKVIRSRFNKNKIVRP